MSRRPASAALPLLLGTVAAVAAPADDDKPKPAPAALFRLADANKDGKLSKAEFGTMAEKAPRLKGNPKSAEQAFARADADGDGFLTPDEFRAVLPPGPPKGDDAKPANPFRKREEKDTEPAKPAAASKSFADNPTAEQIAFFEKKVRPVLIEHCQKCHGDEPEKLKGGLALHTRDGLRAGGDSGPAVVPGDAEKSLLVRAVRYKDESMQMPPKAKLPDAVVADLETWVKMGAPDPRTTAGGKKPAHEIDIEKGRQHWAYQPVKTVPPPKAGPWATTDVDKFLLAALEAKGLAPVADADPRTVVRRLALDLTGLPPTAETMEAFAFDPSPAAFEKLVDQYLASPAFGERWGRHWLDVARFAESTGKTVNFNYPHAWRYRDYVIDAYNADTPFDHFIRQQLAGDLLDAKTDAERARNAIATGFLAVGAKPLNERNRLQFDLDVADEQIDVTTQAFLATTAACARCHDHKFDPIPQRDYYALAGIFRSTETCYGTVRFVQANHPSPLITLPPGSVPAAVPPLTDRERAAAERTIAEVRKRAADGNDAINRLLLLARVGLEQAKLDAYQKDGTPKLQAMGVRDRYRVTDSPIYVRGEPEKPGEVVPRGVLQVVGTKPVTFTKRSSGRLELADWIASADNPLTARVYVNRVWLHLFGRGIVASPDNFGTTGDAPSNLALLDHLAATFVADGWSTKKLVKRLVMTHAYRLSTKLDPKSFEADPDNALCWRMTPRRLDAEAVRDSVLAVAGRLDAARPVGSPVAKVGEGPTTRPRFGPTVRVDDADKHRSVYLPIVRDNLPEVLSLFDMADPNLIVGDRPSTTVPAQALFLMNNPFVIRNAAAAADRLLAESDTDSDRVRRAYLRFYGRPPSETELSAAEGFLAKYAEAAKSRSKREPWAALCQAMFGSAEFLMRP